MKKIISTLFFVFFAVLLSCGRPSGEFAFKLPEDKGYKKPAVLPEFNSSDEVNWIYSFSSIRGHLKAGVILLKKELVWVDVLSYSDYADSEKTILYGKIQGLDPGDYRLMITEILEDEQKVLDEIEFYIFTDDDIY
jgi:hypothetical protein